MCESEPHVAVFLKDYAKAGKGEIPCRNSTPSPPVVPPVYVLPSRPNT
jgi:hypothetical protein